MSPTFTVARADLCSTFDEYFQPFGPVKVGAARSLDAVLTAAEPFHPSIPVMDHAYSRTFTLTSVPNAIGDVAECDARARGAAPPDPLPPECGEAFGMIVRFQTKGGEAPILRLLWRKEDGVWRIRSYGVERP